MSRTDKTKPLWVRQREHGAVALHELGHSIGMAHSNDPTSVMYDTLSAGETKRQIGKS